MYAIRVASLTLVLVLTFATLPASAQGPANSLQARVAALEAAVAALQQALADGTAARAAADTTLQSNIDAEAAARAAADTTLQSNIDSEAAARAAADTTLQGQIDTLKGNLTEDDLVGTYRAVGLNTLLDAPPAKVAIFTLSSTMTLFAGGTGTVSSTVHGIDLVQGAVWSSHVLGPFPDGPTNINWTYAGGILHITDNTPNLNQDFNVGAGGRVLISAGVGDDDDAGLFIGTRLQ